MRIDVKNIDVKCKDTEIDLTFRGAELMTDILHKTIAAAIKTGGVDNADVDAALAYLVRHAFLNIHDGSREFAEMFIKMAFGRSK